jgi:hypothetical protein
VIASDEPNAPIYMVRTVWTVQLLETGHILGVYSGVHALKQKYPGNWQPTDTFAEHVVEGDDYDDDFDEDSDFDDLPLERWDFNGMRFSEYEILG